MKKKSGRFWVAVMLVMIVILPVISVILLEKGFSIRKEAPASERLLLTDLQQIPDYFTVSHRGDTITKERMQNRVCVIDFASYSCGTINDARERKLFELQEDYYGKTKAFRILTHTLHPQEDQTHQLQIMAERYAAREIWHFLSDPDSSSINLFNFCRKTLDISSSNETDSACPQLVYLVDGEGYLRGVYDPMDEKQNQDLYNDVLFLLNKLNAE